MQAARSIVTHMAGEESELDNGQKLDKQYEVLLRVTPGLEYRHGLEDAEGLAPRGRQTLGRLLRI